MLLHADITITLGAAVSKVQSDYVSDMMLGSAIKDGARPGKAQRTKTTLLYIAIRLDWS